MLKAMLASAMLLTAAPAMATDWMLIDVGGDPGNRAGFMMDRDSIVAPTADTRRASMMIIGYAFTAKGEIEIDCTARRWHTLSSEIRNDGEPPIDYTPDPNWHSAEESLGGLIDFACADAATRKAMRKVSFGAGDPVAAVRVAMQKADGE